MVGHMPIRAMVPIETLLCVRCCTVGRMPREQTYSEIKTLVGVTPEQYWTHSPGRGLLCFKIIVYVFTSCISVLCAPSVISVETFNEEYLNFMNICTAPVT